MIKIRNDIPQPECKIIFHGTEIKSPIAMAIARATADLGDKIVIIYHYPNAIEKLMTTTSAFAFNHLGQILWEVQPFAPDNQSFSNHYLHFQYYDEKLVLGTHLGNRACLDTESGRIEILPVGRPW